MVLDPNATNEDVTPADTSNALEMEIEEKMAAIREADTSDADEPDGVTEETAADADAGLSEPDSDGEAHTDDVDESEAADNESSTLPANYRRAALARGWTNEEVDHYTVLKPEEAMDTFKDVFEAWREENSRYSTRGRQLRDADPVKPSDASEKSEDADDGAMGSIDAKALIEQYGNDDIINALVAPVNAAIERVNAMQKAQQEAVAITQTSQQEALATTVTEFFGSAEMKSYTDVYGSDIATMTEDQEAARLALLQEADCIWTGASAHGQDMTVADAMSRALAIVSSGTKDVAIRNEIRASLKKRTKTLPGTQRKVAEDTDEDAPVSEEDLVSRTEARMRALKEKS